jgi:cell division septation protein DedD
MKAGVLALLLVVGTAALAAANLAPDLQALQAKAQNGDPDAEFRLGEAYRFGRGVEADPEMAIMWYRRATAHGNIRASEELGFALFAHGDRREAMPFIERAAARGEPRAFYLLGTAHFNGDYASRDWPLAYAQTMRAASAGLSAAQRNLELMDHYLLPSDKDKAQQILATLPLARVSAQSQPKARVDAMGASSSPSPTSSAAPVQTASLTSDAKGKSSAATNTPKPAPPPPAQSAAPVAKGNWKVQLGAFGSAERVEERWKMLTAKISGLKRYERRVIVAGSIQRLQVIGIASKADAEALCTKVVAAKGDCLVMAP